MHRDDLKAIFPAIYLPLLVPVILFVTSLFVRPAMVFDTTAGFWVFRDMMAGGPFNYSLSPDPANIANNIQAFMTWWSPGQYLAPGIFVYLGASDGLAICLTALITSVVGALGWIKVARNYGVPCFALVLFVTGLVAFHYAALPFRLYNGGEVLLFAASPWSLLMLQWALQKGPIASFSTSLLVAVLLFLAKLSGLFVFGATVAALSVLDLWKSRRPKASLLAMWAGGAVAALLLLVFWIPRGQTAVTIPQYTFTWLALLFPIASAAFSGFSLHDLLSWLFLRPSDPVLSSLGKTSYIFGPLGIFLVGWVWLQLRHTRLRPMAICFLTILAFYSAAFALTYIRTGPNIPFEERYFRYAGILFFLLLLVAMDQWRAPWNRIIPVLIVGAFATYGLVAHAKGVRNLMRGHYDAASGTSMLAVSPEVLAYLRSERASHDWKNAVAVAPEPEAANGLPGFRIIFDFSLQDAAPIEEISRQRWAGKVDKIFIIVYSRMRDDGKAQALLKTFVDYDPAKWTERSMGGMVVYSQ